MVNYYILYPKYQKDRIKITTTRPNPQKEIKKYGFAEGPFTSKTKVRSRFRQLNLPKRMWPLSF